MNTQEDSATALAHFDAGYGLHAQFGLVAAGGAGVTLAELGERPDEQRQKDGHADGDQHDRTG